MGVCLNGNKKEIHAHQIEDIIEYIGYEDFGALERSKTDNRNVLKNRVYSMYNNPGGSSIGQYESEFKEENKNLKKEGTINKSEDVKKENEEVKLRSAVKDEQTEEKNVNNDNNIENKDVKNENNNVGNKLHEIKEENTEIRKENDIIENNVIQENKEQTENKQEIEKSNKEEAINNNNNQEIQNELNKENKEENKIENVIENKEENKEENIVENKIETKVETKVENKEENKEENNNNNNYNNSFNQNNEPIKNDNNNNQQNNENANPQLTFSDNNNQNIVQPQLQVEVEVKQEIIEENAKPGLRSVNENKNYDNVNINNNSQNKSNDTFSKKVKLPSLNTIVSEKLLAEGAGNELLFISNLSKIEQISIKERVKYVERFCMVTKDNFIIYDNKEDYITIKKPLAVIPINSIINVVLFKLTKKVLSYDHFYIEFKIDTADNMNVYNQLSTFFINDNKENIIRQKETALLMFKTEEKMLAKKWYVLIKYLIDIKKNNTPNQNIVNN